MYYKVYQAVIHHKRIETLVPPSYLPLPTDLTKTMAAYTASEKCAPLTWVTLAHDTRNQVLVEQKVKSPDPQQMFDDIVDCMGEATDARIRRLGQPETWYDTAEKLVNEGPWEVHTDEQDILLLYKLWYDSVTIKMGVKPQVTVYSEQKPSNMPNHWLHVYRPDMQWKCDENGGLYNEEGGVRINYMHPETTPQCLFEDNWVDDEKNAPIPVARSSNRIRIGVQRLSYNHQGQYTYCEI